MFYTATNPPVIKSNLGTEPWPDIGSTAPLCLLYDDTGASIATTSSTMTQVTGSPVWIFKTGDLVSTPFADEDKEIFYVITRGAGGEVVDDGSVKITSTATLTGVLDEVASSEINYPAALEIPNSGGASKSFRISMVPKKQNGQVVTITSAALDITFAEAGNTDILAAAMTDSGNDLWVYDFVVDSNYVPDIATLTITTTKGAQVLPMPPKNIQLFKRDQFNPLRIAQGVVI